MKKNILITLLLMFAVADTYAQWPTNAKDYLFIANDIIESQIATVASGPHKGKTWVFWNTLRQKNETIHGQYIPVSYKATYVQLLDTNGNKLFGPNGKLVDDQRAGMTFTMTGEKLFVDRDGNAIVLSVDGRNMVFNQADPYAQTQNQSQTFLYKIAPELIEGDLDFIWENVDPTGTCAGLQGNQKIIQLTDNVGNPSDYICSIGGSGYLIDKNTGTVKGTIAAGTSMMANNDGTYFLYSGSSISRRSSSALAMWTKSLSATYSSRPKKNNKQEPVVDETDNVKYADGKSATMVSDGKGGVVVLFQTAAGDYNVQNVAYFDGSGTPYFINPNTEKAYVAVGAMTGYAQHQASVAYEPITNSIYIGTTNFNWISQSWGYASIQRINAEDGTRMFGVYGKIIDGSPTMNQFVSPHVITVPGCDSVYFTFGVNYGNPMRTYYPVYLVNHENENQWCTQVSMNKNNEAGFPIKYDASYVFNAGGVVFAWKRSSTTLGDAVHVNKVYLSGIVGNSDPIVCCGPGTGVECPCVEGVNCLCDTTNCECDTCKMSDYCDPNSLCRTTCPNAGWYCDYCSEYCDNVDTCELQGCAGCPNAVYQACPTAVSNESETTGITVTPNPAYETITVTVKEGEIVKTIDVYDMSGKMMIPRIFHPTNLQISLENLAAGIYTLVITTQNGTASKVFIKK